MELTKSEGRLVKRVRTAEKYRPFLFWIMIAGLLFWSTMCAIAIFDLNAFLDERDASLSTIGEHFVDSDDPLVVVEISTFHLYLNFITLTILVAIQFAGFLVFIKILSRERKLLLKFLDREEGKGTTDA